VVAVGKNLVAKIPDNVSFEQASFTLIASIALQGIRLFQPTLGEKVVVIGYGRWPDLHLQK
jgi:threonine dehydrogenase-like Zn-dependent dehydrogenase